ncbi:MAG: ABC transporter permease [Acidobacteria bacterium]|nr:MAG: ABC transporter permease [Acidobacteriota bacterium]REK04007.1 MAG: ABC transporter permease [Acidobacteriota bacterium]REK15169.1 MAG: ABC transporter permease [Acidobacteriota bacterium]REK46259.1 MAG: ABC transporter permease [Acidobacteriota bacterium]
MRLWDLARTANRNLLRAKLRTFLTVMAIFVGAFTLCMTNGIGDGLRNYVELQVKTFEGDRILFVRKKFPQEMEEQINNTGPVEYKETSVDERGNEIDPNSVMVSLEQIKGLESDLPEVRSITPAFRMSAEYITVGGGKKYTVGLGMLSEGLVQKLEVGEMFDGSNQIILPIHLARAFDENVQNLVGQDATIAYRAGQERDLKTRDLKVVGVATKGMISNTNAFVDADTARSIYDEQNAESPNYNNFQNFTVQLERADDELVGSTKEKLEEKGFVAMGIEDIEKRTYDAIGILQVGLNLFALVALLAASFGIINTLVIAVMERTKEIGLQKALGMGRFRVFLLFALESVLIGFWGAMLGIVSAVGVGTAANAFLSSTYLESFEGFSLFAFKPLALGVVLLLVCVIAFLAGVMPAIRASRLNPIEALRYE